MSESEAKKHGLRLPNVPISLRSFKRPCSGRTAPVPHFCSSCQTMSLAGTSLLTYGTTDGTEKHGIG